MIKYLCFGGTVVSKNDGDIHFVGAERLARLYNVPPKECLFLNPNGSPQDVFTDQQRLIRLYPEAIILEPDYSGEYTITKEIK